MSVEPVLKKFRTVFLSDWGATDSSIPWSTLIDQTHDQLTLQRRKKNFFQTSLLLMGHFTRSHVLKDKVEKHLLEIEYAKTDNQLLILLM